MKPAAFLSALQVGDSAFPIGRFAHSYGLEEVFTRDPELTEDAIAELVESIILEAVAPLDGVAVAGAHRLAAAGDLEGLVALDHAVTVRKITPSSRRASTACGRRLAALTCVLTDDETIARFAERVDAGRSDGNLAVVEGALSFALDIGVEEAVLLELRGTAAALLSAALRLGKISATRAQALATRLIPPLIEALEISLKLRTEEMRAVAPELDVATIRHGRREARLFAT
jgi:urease accessory protein